MAEVNREEVESRLARLRDTHDVQVREEREEVPADVFPDLRDLAAEGYTGGGYVWVVREPATAMHAAADVEVGRVAGAEVLAPDDDGRLAVAVVDRGILDGWIEALADAGLEADQIYPEQLAVPLEPESWAVVVDSDRFLLRTGTQTGLAGDAQNLPDMLEACLLDAETPPGRIVIHDFTGHASVPSVEPDVEYRTVDSEDATSLLARSLDERRAIPLLVGDYAKSSGWRAHWERWRAVAVLAALWVVLSTGHAYLQQWQLGREAAALQNQIVATYRDAFPDADRVIDPRNQMESRLSAMRNQGQGGHSGLLPILAKIGPVLSRESGLELTALSYRGGDLDVELYAENLQSIDQLKQRLGRVEGVSVEVRSAKAEGERVQGRLRIQETT
jgi:general secretion pathway protein L